MKKIYKMAGERIMIARTIHGYSRECLAEMASISSKFLYEIETGKKGFSAGVLIKICKALEVNCDYIMTGKNKGKEDEKLTLTIQMFDERQRQYVCNILKEITEMLDVL